MKLDKNTALSLGGLAIGGFALYQNMKDPTEDEGGFFGFGGGSTQVDGTLTPTTETTQENVLGLPSLVFSDATKLQNTYTQLGSKSKLDFSYNEQNQVTTINIDGQDVGEYDYKNNVSRDLTLNKQSSGGSSKKSSKKTETVKPTSTLNTAKSSSNSDFVGPIPQSKKSTKKEEPKQNTSNFFSSIGVRI
jgi:hypothetical protein